MLPDWRPISLKDMANSDFAFTFDKGRIAIVEYVNNKPVRVICIVSQFYKTVPPKTYFVDIAHIASKHMNGDVSIIDVSVTQSRVFVRFKLPSMFALTSNPRDSFGLTLVACNPYSGKEAHKIGAGAIRGFCDNGCYFGAHESVSYSHKRRHGDDDAEVSSIDASKITQVIDKALPLAQTYVDRMVSIQLNKKAGNFSQSELKAESLITADAVEHAETIIQSMPISPKQRISIIQSSHQDESSTISLYDLWNACTYVATRQKNVGSVHKMMSIINDTFMEGGSADCIRHRKKIQQDCNLPPPTAAACGSTS